MLINAKEKKAINKYLREFVIAHNDFFREADFEKNTIIKIQKRENIPFHKNWEYLMVLVQLIENKWKLEKIETCDNWVKFSSNHFDNIQDKGMTKMEAFYLCCFKTLTKLWKEQKPPLIYENHEPFDEIDLK